MDVLVRAWKPALWLSWDLGAGEGAGEHRAGGVAGGAPCRAV